jgi:hypothetical protein
LDPSGLQFCDNMRNMVARDVSVLLCIPDGDAYESAAITVKTTPIALETRKSLQGRKKCVLRRVHHVLFPSWVIASLRYPDIHG